MSIFLGVAVVALLLWKWYAFDRGQQNKKIEAIFGSREPLTKETFYQRYYQDKGVPFHIVSGVQKVLEEQLGAEMSRLRSTDDLSGNLSFFFEYDSMADVEIVCALEEEFGINITNGEAESLGTIDQIVYFVTDKVRLRQDNV